MNENIEKPRTGESDEGTDTNEFYFLLATAQLSSLMNLILRMMIKR